MASEFGVPLSQLLQKHVDPIITGILSLDSQINGLQNRCIYEIYGPPGVGITKLGAQIVVENTSSKVPDRRALWIDTFQQAPIERLGKSNCTFTRVTKFTQLWYYFHRLDTRFDIVVVDGLSQILNDYINISETSYQLKQTHDLKIRCLIQLMTAMTKYATKNNAVILLLNNAMNTAYQDYSDDSLTSYVEIDPKLPHRVSPPYSSFLVKSQKKRHVQVLKSALVANSAVGTKDHRWEIFLKGRIGMFWNWDPVKKGKVPLPLRRIVVQIQGLHDTQEISILLTSDHAEKFKDYQNNELLQHSHTQQSHFADHNQLLFATDSSPPESLHPSCSDTMLSNKRQKLMDSEGSSPSKNNYNQQHNTSFNRLFISSNQPHPHPHHSTNSAPPLAFTPRFAFSDTLFASSRTYSQPYYEEDTFEDSIENTTFVSDVIYDSEG